MKRIIALLVMLLISTVSYADNSKHDFSIGTEVSSITYKEPELMKNKGIMKGITGSYTYRNRLLLKAEGRYAFGEVDYSSPISGTMDDIKDYIIEGRGLVGYGISPKPFGFEVSPYTGIGYRYLNNDMGHRFTSVGHFGYERESMQWYLPLGLELIKSFKNNWSVVITGEVNTLLRGRQKNHVGYIPGYVDFTNKQRNGFGQRVSLELKKETPKITYSIGPFLRHSDIRQSETAVGAYIIPTIPIEFIEPRNQSTEVGVQFKVTF